MRLKRQRPLAMEEMRDSVPEATPGTAWQTHPFEDTQLDQPGFVRIGCSQRHERRYPKEQFQR